MKHPLQPLETDSDGEIRFAGNAIVDLLLSTSKLDLYDLHRMVARDNYSVEDYAQLMMLLGYSVGGFLELSCSDVCADEVETARHEFKGQLIAQLVLK